MSAWLIVTATRTGPTLQVPGSILLRVRPAEGRTDERVLGLGSENIEVPAGEGEVQVIYASGQIESQTYSVADGKEQRIEFVVPGSPHEAMAWLSLARDPARRPTVRAAPRPTVLRALRPLGAHDQLESVEGVEVGLLAAHTERQADVRVTALDGATKVSILNDFWYDEGRVLHLRDARDVDVFRQPKGSMLASLEITQAADPDVIRVCALPGPFGMQRGNRETHVALRAATGDELPDVQIVPADKDLAPVVGFLERGNQRALGALRERLVSWARDAMLDKMSDPVAAAIGMAVLLRLGEQQTVSGWSANLWRWFPGLPDGGALHAAVLIQQPPVGDVVAWHAELRSAVLDSCRAGMPLLSDSVRHLRGALVALRGVEKPDPEVEAAASWCHRVARAMNADAVFTTLTFEADDRGLPQGMSK